MKRVNLVLGRAIAGCSFLVAAGQTVHGAEIAWVGTGVDNNWSTDDNLPGFNTGGPHDLIFGNDDRTGNNTVNNVVDANTTISSLSYLHNGSNSTANWHVTEIASGITLTINGGGAPSVGLPVVPGGGGDTTEPNVLRVGAQHIGNGTVSSFVKMTGGGSLEIAAPTGNVLVSNTSSNNLGSATLDLSGLSSFSADVANFFVGRGPRSQSIVTLAAEGDATNSITASVLSIGDTNNSAESNGTSELRLGDNNTLRADSIFVGAPTVTNRRSVQNGKIVFQAGITDGEVAIRGKAGGNTRADLTIGSHGVRTSSPTNTNRSITGSHVDFTGGTVDARLGAVLLGEGQGAFSSSSGAMHGQLTMSAGSIDALSVVLGRSNTGSSTNASTGFATGTLNINGGTFTTGTLQLAINQGGGQKVAGNLNIAGGDVSVTGGGITMGARSGSAVSGTIVPTITLTDGSLTVAGDIAEGANGADIASAVNVSGGTLDLTGNVAANIIVDALNLTADGQLSLFVGQSGVNSAILGNGTATLDAMLAFDLSEASATLGDSWEIVAPTVSASYGDSFAVAGFTLDAGAWYGNFNSTIYKFDPSVSTLTVVPEPATLGLLAAGGALILARRTRRRAC